MTYELVDVHVHLGMSSVLDVAGSLSEVLRKMDLNGISMSVISPIPGYEDPRGLKDTQAQNDGIAAAVREHPDRIPRGFGVVEPRHGSDALREVDRVMGELSLVGLSFHNDFAGLPIDHPAMLAILDRLATYPNAIVQMHTALHSVLEAPFQLGRVARMFPSLTFLNAHPFMDGPGAQASIDLGEQHPNIVFDTSVSYTLDTPLADAVSRLGASRLLWASSNPYYETTMDIPLLLNAEISDADRRAISSENARRLFGLD